MSDIISKPHMSSIAASEALVADRPEEAREWLARALLDLSQASKSPDLVRELKKLVRDDPKPDKRPETAIARILATQYYNGWNNAKRCTMTKDEYIANSLHNWISAARGIIHLVNNPDMVEKWA